MANQELQRLPPQELIPPMKLKLGQPFNAGLLCDTLMRPMQKPKSNSPEMSVSTNLDIEGLGKGEMTVTRDDYMEFRIKIKIMDLDERQIQTIAMDISSKDRKPIYHGDCAGYDDSELRRNGKTSGVFIYFFDSKRGRYRNPIEIIRRMKNLTFAVIKEK